MSKDFGIIIACCARDYIFAKGCCASIRYFMGDVPIALIVDGDFSTKELEDVYQVKIINRANVSLDVLREKSFGFGLTKMVAFWESPWKHFLYLDADTTAWGNILKFANFDEFDFILDKPRYDRSDQDISNYFLDIKRIGRYFPDFNWSKYRNYFFCTGVFFGTRGIFSVEEYVDILDLVSREPKLFYVGEQGFLNFMLFQAADQGRIRLSQAPLQFLVPDFPLDIAQKTFPLDHKTGPVYQDEDVIIHWCGRNKPISITSAVYAQPMTFSRKQFITDTSSPIAGMVDTLLKIEDLQYYFYLYRNKVRRKLARFIS